jgi:hypothetical protein
MYDFCFTFKTIKVNQSQGQANVRQVQGVEGPLGRAKSLCALFAHVHLRGVPAFLAELLGLRQVQAHCSKYGLGAVAYHYRQVQVRACVSTRAGRRVLTNGRIGEGYAYGFTAFYT